MSWDSYYKFWSSSFILARYALFIIRGCKEKNYIHGTSCADYRWWSADPSILREVFYEHSHQSNVTDNSSFVSSNEMYESLSTDKDKIIDKLSQRLEPHIENRELIKTLTSNSYDNFDNVTSNTNNNYNGIKTCSLYYNGNTIHSNDTLPFEEMYESLLNDQDKVTYGLVYHLKSYISNNEIYKLINVNSYDSKTIFNRLKIFYPQIKCIISRVSCNLKNILSFTTFELFKYYRNRCTQNKMPVTDHGKNDKKQIQKNYNQTNCLSNDKVMISTRDNLKQPSHKCIHSDKLKNQSTCITCDNEHICIKNKSVYDILLQKNIENNRLLREIRLQNVVKQNTLMKMRRMNKKIIEGYF